MNHASRRTFLFRTDFTHETPITVATRSKAWTVFAHSNAGIVCSNPIQCMDDCVCAFILCLCCPVYVAALRRAEPQSKESCRLCKNYYETEEEARAQQRAVEPLINEKWKK
jgi:hypothetical protein